MIVALENQAHLCVGEHCWSCFHQATIDRVEADMIRDQLWDRVYQLKEAGRNCDQAYLDWSAADKPLMDAIGRQRKSFDTLCSDRQLPVLDITTADRAEEDAWARVCQLDSARRELRRDPPARSRDLAEVERKLVFAWFVYRSADARAAAARAGVRAKAT